MIVSVVASIGAAAGSSSVSSQASRSTAEGLRLLHKLQDALGGATRIAAIRDFEETIRAQVWDARGTNLGDVRKRSLPLTPAGISLADPIDLCRARCAIWNGKRLPACVSPHTA